MQLNIDFSRRIPALDAKRTERIPIAAPTLTKEMLTLVANELNSSASELGHRYLVEGIVKDLGFILMTKGNANKKLSEFLSMMRA